MTKAGSEDSMDMTGFTIEWAENPLKSKILLDDYGRLRLKCAIAVDSLSDASVLIGLELKGELARNGRRWIENYEYANSDIDIDADITEETARCEEYLKDQHCGDCTCAPMSCSRCHAESLLGVWTTSGLGKHEGNNVQSAFSDGRETLAAALHWLTTSAIEAKWEGWERYIDRWTRERKSAIEWLKAYAIAHGFKVQND